MADCSDGISVSEISRITVGRYGDRNMVMAVVVFDFEDDLYIRVDGVLFLPGEIVACGKTEFEYSRIVLVRREKIGNSAV